MSWRRVCVAPDSTSSVSCRRSSANLPCWPLGWPARCRSFSGYPVQLRRTDEIVYRQSTDRMRREGDVAVVVAEPHVGMVILAVGEVRERPHEAHRVVEILKFVCALQALVVGGDGLCDIHAPPQRIGFDRSQRLRAAYAGDALFI